MKARWALAVSVLVLLTGCNPPTPPTPAPPTPTFMCTPEAGGPEASCSQSEFDKMKARDAEYAEAEKVYRKFIAEYVRVMKSGGGTKLTPDLDRLLGNKELKAAMLKRMKIYKEQGFRLVGPGLTIESIVRLAGRVAGDSVVAMSFCLGAKGMATYRGSENQGSWAPSKEEVFFKRSGQGGLVIADSSTESVRSCGK